MKKFTWQHLGQIFEGQFNLTTAEAAEILTGHIFNHKWKHGKDKNIGMMWRDEMIVAAFTHVIAEEEEFAKQVGRKKSLRKLFNDGVSWVRFKEIAGLKYTKGGEGYRTFVNDIRAWKRLKFFKNVYLTGKRTENKKQKRIKTKTYAADKVLDAEHDKEVEGRLHTKKLLESGEYEKIKDMLGNIGLRKIQK